MVKNVVKLSEYRKRKKRESKHENEPRLALSPLWIASGAFAIAVAVVFVYLVFTGSKP
ncbi:hypothetical protein DSLASN_32880 [Desulfoluna limicola]|uniref:Uncharacterized protein n=1 Tax=Desulfoluna limicola TaxID=2810562 RepID=A0ABN6F7Q0_9BACT|nr:hypothetical protein DSLASN_32880 [Desulfoluna limicola]